MTRPEKIALLKEMMNKDPEATIRDWMEAVEEIERIESAQNQTVQLGPIIPKHTQKATSTSKNKRNDLPGANSIQNRVFVGVEQYELRY